MSFLQIYIGTSRSTVVQNQDIVKQLRIGMLIAIKSIECFPKIGKVVALPPNLSLTSDISVHWMIQEQAPHKPKWVRFFKPSKKRNAEGTTPINDVVLYGFELTANGALRKKTREYLRANI